MLPFLAALALSPGPLMLREAKVELTPPEPLPLGGYTERHDRLETPGGEKLYARVDVLERGRFELAIVSAETLTIPESLVREVRARLPAHVRLFLCATHTHCAPDSQLLNDRMTFKLPGIATYKRRWLAWYADRIAGAVRAAMAARPVPLTSMSVERWTADLNRGRRKGAAPDKTATLLVAGATPILFAYAAHGTFYDADENQTRGDWPGGVGRLAPLALIGPIGDVSPKAPGLDHAPPAQKIADFWRLMLADKATEKRTRVWRAGAPLGWVATPIEFGKPRPHPTFGKTYKVPESLGRLLVDKFAPPAAQIDAFRLGSLAVVGVPGEPTSHLGRQIAAAGARDGFADVLVVSHCDGWAGYMLDPKDYDAGGYEAILSFYGRNGGLRVAQAAERALRTLAATPR